MKNSGSIEEMRKFLGCADAIEVEEVEDLQVAYRRTARITVPSLHKELLEPNPDPERLFPGAPNRAAVAHNFQQSLVGFKKGYELHRQSTAEHGLKDWREVLQLNLRHIREACRWITNGQLIVTVLKMDEKRFSVGMHDAIEWFLSDFADAPSLVRIAIVSTLAEADKRAIEWLSVVHEREIPVRLHGKQTLLYWRAWGLGCVMTVNGRRVWTASDSDDEEAEPYAVLNRLPTLFPGVIADTCATCRHFRFSGLSRDMSRGSKGYCFEPSRRKDDDLVVTDVVDRCDHHAFIHDSDREIPYLRK